MFKRLKFVAMLAKVEVILGEVRLVLQDESMFDLGVTLFRDTPDIAKVRDLGLLGMAAAALMEAADFATTYNFDTSTGGSLNQKLQRVSATLFAYHVAINGDIQEKDAYRIVAELTPTIGQTAKEIIMLQQLTGVKVNINNLNSVNGIGNAVKDTLEAF